jgi:Mce-associated membrane protein
MVTGGKRVAEAKEPPQDSATAKADARALLEEAEAEAAEAEALAAAARARARAARLRREALAEAAQTPEATETTEAAETPDTEEPSSDAADAADTAEDSGAQSDEDAPEETVEAAEPESRPSRRRLRLPSLSATLKVAAVVLILGFVGVTGYMAWQDHEATERSRRAANFLAGARQGIINMTSLDFNHAKEDVQRVIDSSTGQFRDDFAQRAKDFTSVVEQSKVTTQGTVNAAALESMDGNSASVLVSATSKITNAAGAKDEPRVFRLRVTVTEDGGQYKMSKVDFVP